MEEIFDGIQRVREQLQEGLITEREALGHIIMACTEEYESLGAEHNEKHPPLPSETTSQVGEG